ncbi:hypothetical protein Fmac_016616 [Flemingia macrophylla]|uniref:Mitochondrial carrier protein n=1 Tax=Flemingia macrophylla TaxID=520843 RepID=A0ABD1MIQ4_9FABA
MAEDINWDRLDKVKFFVLGTGLFTGVTVALYPVSVVKTRLQVASKDTLERSAFSVVKGLLKTHGVPGLYKGFGPVITGTIPARILFLTALETSKAASLRMLEPFRLPETSQTAIANGIAGLGSAFLSQAVFVPVDVVSQKLMVQGYSGHAQYSGGLDVARKLLRSDGIKGLYKGFGLSVMTYTPSSAVWWASYSSSKNYIWRLLGYNSSEVGTLGLPNRGVGTLSLPNSDVLSSSLPNSGVRTPSLPKIIFVQATGGIIAAAAASCFTTPLDTIKTRLQVTALEKKISVKQVAKDLIREEGWKGLYKGLGPRFVSMSAWGTSMVLVYEYLSKKSCSLITFCVYNPVLLFWFGVFKY